MTSSSGGQNQNVLSANPLSRKPWPVVSSQTPRTHNKNSYFENFSPILHWSRSINWSVQNLLIRRKVFQVVTSSSGGEHNGGQHITHPWPRQPWPVVSSDRFHCQVMLHQVADNTKRNLSDNYIFSVSQLGFQSRAYKTSSNVTVRKVLSSKQVHRTCLMNGNEECAICH